LPRRQPAPVALEKRLLRALDVEAGPVAGGRWIGRARRYVADRRQWFGGAAAGAAFAAAVAVILVLALPRSEPDELFDELAAANTRILIAQHAVDIESTDTAKLSMWFNHRTALAPPIADLSAQGFQLLGGRAEYIGGKRVAALVYGHDTHFINLFVWSDYESAIAPGSADRDGFHFVMWSGNGLVFCLVSDESMPTLQTVAKLVTAAMVKSTN